jgi:cell filamentation protein
MNKSNFVPLGFPMKRPGRYNTTGLPEDTYEPGSHKRVLKNLLGIKQKKKMDETEAKAQSRTLELLINQYDRNHRFTAADVCEIHKIWLGEIYEWAGRYRQVDIQKGNVRFTVPQFISQEMEELERKYLRRYTPCTLGSLDETVTAISIVHAELVRIHPFREGNGRVARLLAILMALQAGLPILDFTVIRGKMRENYFAAVRAGWDSNYEPMDQIFRKVISKTLRIFGKE